MQFRHNPLFQIPYTLLVGTVVALLLAVLPMLSVYYTLLRFVVFVKAGWMAWIFLQIELKTYSLCIIAVSAMFNTILPLYLDRDMWMIIDFFSAVVLTYLTLMLHRILKNNDFLLYANGSGGMCQRIVEACDDWLSEQPSKPSPPVALPDATSPNTGALRRDAPPE